MSHKQRVPVKTGTLLVFRSLVARHKNAEKLLLTFQYSHKSLFQNHFTGF